MYFGEISQANLVKSNSERINHNTYIVLYIFEQFFPLKTNKELIVNNCYFILEYFDKVHLFFWATKWEASFLS